MAAPRSTWTILRAAFRPSPFLRQSVVRPAARRTVAGVGDAPAITGQQPAGGFGKLWNSPIGPKTVHFWAPIAKVGLQEQSKGKKSSGLQEKIVWLLSRQWERFSRAAHCLEKGQI